MKLCKKLIAAIAVIAMLLSCLPAAAAADVRAEVPEGYDFNVYVDFEAFTLGWGFILEPVAVPANEGETVAEVTLRALELAGLAVNYTGTPTAGFVLKGVECHETQANIPAYIMEQFDVYPAWANENLGMPYGQWTGARTDADMLSVYDFSSFSGWMFAIDDAAASVGADGAVVAEGEMYRWEFTVYGWGMDCGLNDGWGMFPEFDNPAEGVYRSDVLKGYAELKEDSIIAPKLAEGGAAHAEAEAFFAAAGNIASSRADIEAAYAELLDACYEYTVYVDFEAFTMGWGYIAEPFAVPANPGENAAVITLRALDMLGMQSVYGGSPESGFYLRGVECPYTVPNVPDYLMTELLAYPAWAEENMGMSFGEWTGAFTDDGILMEMEFSSFAGWMFAIDDAAASVGADGVTVNNGEMIRWMFSVYGWGMDCGLNDGWGMFPEFDNPAEGIERAPASVGYAQLAANETYAAMMAEGGEAHDEYVNFINAITNIASSQAEIDAAYAALVDALNGQQPAVPGDANCSGSVDFGDVTLIYLHIIGDGALEGAALINADFNGDSNVDFSDIAYIYLSLIGE